MEPYLLVKWIHVLSSTILFGFGAGTAWYMWNAHLTRDPATIASVGRMVVRADWIFTGTSGIVQPLSGLYLADIAGWPLTTPWLLLAMALLSAGVHLLGAGGPAANQGAAAGTAGAAKQRAAGG